MATDPRVAQLLNMPLDDLDEVLACMSERGMTEWNLAVEKARSTKLAKMLVAARQAPQHMSPPAGDAPAEVGARSEIPGLDPPADASAAAAEEGAPADPGEGESGTA